MNKLLGSIGLFSLSAFMLLGFAKADLSEKSMAVKTMTFSLGVGIPLMGGLGLISSHRQEQNRLNSHQAKAQLRTLKAEILKLATVNQGKLTEIEIISALGIEATVAKEVLTHLCQQDLADIEMTDSGLLVYAFPDIQQLPQKHTSRGLLDA